MRHDNNKPSAAHLTGTTVSDPLRNKGRIGRCNWPEAEAVSPPAVASDQWASCQLTSVDELIDRLHVVTFRKHRREQQAD